MFVFFIIFIFHFGENISCIWIVLNLQLLLMLFRSRRAAGAHSHYISWGTLSYVVNSLARPYLDALADKSVSWHRFGVRSSQSGQRRPSEGTDGYF